MRRRRLIAAFAAVALLTVPAQAAATPLVFPVRVDDGFTIPGPPEVTAASWLIYDETADLVLASFAPVEERAMASTTKIMTGLLVLENSNLDDVVTISAKAAAVGEKEIDLVAGEQVTMDALFKALMIHSANDAAIAVAEHISGSESAFVDLMNERAVELGLTGTRFANPHGLDESNHYSTAADLLTLTRVAMSHPEFALAVRSRALVFPPAPDGTPRVGAATNLLLGVYDGVIGVKTGFTNEALLTFVATAERDGRRVYVIVLGSDGTRAHFADATLLFDYAFGHLGFVHSATVGTGYTAAFPGQHPDPLASTADRHALVHIASQGLLEGAPPPSAGPDDEPPPAPTIVVKRSPSEGPASVTDALRYWVELVFGRG